MGQLQQREMKVLAFLQSQEDYVTSEMLAKELRVSVRTMKTILKELRKDLPSFGCELLVKRGSGYRLQVKEESRFQSLQKNFS